MDELFLDWCYEVPGVCVCVCVCVSLFVCSSFVLLPSVLSFSPLSSPWQTQYLDTTVQDTHTHTHRQTGLMVHTKM